MENRFEGPILGFGPVGCEFVVCHRQEIFEDESLCVAWVEQFDNCGEDVAKARNRFFMAGKARWTANQGQGDERFEFRRELLIRRQEPRVPHQSDFRCFVFPCAIIFNYQ